MDAQCGQLCVILQAMPPCDDNSKILLQAQVFKEAKDTARSRRVLRVGKRKFSFFKVLNWEFLGFLSLSS